MPASTIVHRQGSGVGTSAMAIVPSPPSSPPISRRSSITGNNCNNTTTAIAAPSTCSHPLPPPHTSAPPPPPPSIPAAPRYDIASPTVSSPPYSVVSPQSVVSPLSSTLSRASTLTSTDAPTTHRCEESVEATELEWPAAIPAVSTDQLQPHAPPPPLTHQSSSGASQPPLSSSLSRSASCLESFLTSSHDGSVPPPQLSLPAPSQSASASPMRGALVPRRPPLPPLQHATPRSMGRTLGPQADNVAKSLPRSNLSPQYAGSAATAVDFLTFSTSDVVSSPLSAGGRHRRSPLNFGGSLDSPIPRKPSSTHQCAAPVPTQRPRAFSFSQPFRRDHVLASGSTAASETNSPAAAATCGSGEGSSDSPMRITRSIVTGNNGLAPPASQQSVPLLMFPQLVPPRANSGSNSGDGPTTPSQRAAQKHATTAAGVVAMKIPLGSSMYARQQPPHSAGPSSRQPFSNNAAEFLTSPPLTAAVSTSSPITVPSPPIRPVIRRLTSEETKDDGFGTEENGGMSLAEALALSPRAGQSRLLQQQQRGVVATPPRSRTARGSQRMAIGTQPLRTDDAELHLDARTPFQECFFTLPVGGDSDLRVHHRRFSHDSGTAADDSSLAGAADDDSRPHTADPLDDALTAALAQGSAEKTKGAEEGVGAEDDEGDRSETPPSPFQHVFSPRLHLNRRSKQAPQAEGPQVLEVDVSELPVTRPWTHGSRHTNAQQVAHLSRSHSDAKSRPAAVPTGASPPHSSSTVPSAQHVRRQYSRAAVAAQQQQQLHHHHQPQSHHFSPPQPSSATIGGAPPSTASNSSGSPSPSDSPAAACMPIKIVTDHAYHPTSVGSSPPNSSSNLLMMQATSAAHSFSDSTDSAAGQSASPLPVADQICESHSLGVSARRHKRRDTGSMILLDLRGMDSRRLAEALIVQQQLHAGTGVAPVAAINPRQNQLPNSAMHQLSPPPASYTTLSSSAPQSAAAPVALLHSSSQLSANVSPPSEAESLLPVVRGLTMVQA